MTSTLAVVDICNFALRNAQAPLIESLDEDSESAIECNLRYEQARDVCLTLCWWGFAKKIVTLAEMSSNTGEWDYAYQYPADCLQARYIVNPLGRNAFPAIKFEIVGDEIHTNESSAKLAYTKLITDTTRFPTLFVDALSWRLAMDVIPGISGARQQRDEAEKYFEKFMTIARASDGNEGRIDSVFDVDTRDADWVTAR
jgi:hypothetical protein